MFFNIRVIIRNNHIRRVFCHSPALNSCHSSYATSKISLPCTPISQHYRSRKIYWRIETVIYHHRYFPIFYREATRVIQPVHIAFMPTDTRHIIGIVYKEALAVIIYLIQRSVIHRSKHFSHSRGALRSLYRQAPFFFLSGA